MKFAEFSVRNSLLVNMLSVFILICGVMAMLHLRRDAFPQVSYDILTITASYPGAPAEDVEKLVTIPLEKELKGISGIEKMTSVSDEGLSEIGIYIDPQTQDKRKVINDVQSAVDRVQDLPETVDDPVVFELNSREIPILEISLSGLDEFVRRDYAQTLEDQLLDVPGVASVRRFGWRDRQFWVEADPQRLKDEHVSLEEIMAALDSRNITLPAGQLTAPTEEFTVRTTAEFTTAAEIGEVVIRANDAGYWLKVKDIAQVRPAFEDPTTISKVNGRPATAMVVVKKEQDDAINVVRRVKNVVEHFRKTLPEGMEVSLSNDFSYYIERRLGVLRNNGLVGFVLVIAVLFLFLDPWPAFLTALGIPIALFSTFMVMALMGMSINLVSMIGLLIVLGMIVDDGIIVSENVFRYIEQGWRPKDAAVKGANEVMVPVTVVILTTFAAFTPLLFMKDILGKFIREIPIVVLITLSASLVEAFVILPSHLADFVRCKRPAGAQPHQHAVEPKGWFRTLVDGYTRVLTGALRHRYLVLGALVLMFVSAVLLVKMNVVKLVLFGGEGIEYFYVRAESPKGTPLEQTGRLLAPVEALVAGLPPQELDTYRTYIGSIEEEGRFDPNAKRGTHLGQITVFLTPLQKRSRTPQDIMNALRPRLQEVKGFEKLYLFLPKEGPPTGSPVELVARGDDFDVLQKIAGEFSAFLKTVDGVSDIITSYDYGKKQIQVVVDEERARQYGLTVGQVAQSVRHALRGGVATTVKPLRAEDEIDVLVRFPEADRTDQKVFENIMIPNSSGQLVPLSSVARMDQQESLYLIKHLDGKRVIYVTAQVDNDKATSLMVNEAAQKKFQDIPARYPGYAVKYSGEFEDQGKSFRNLLFAFLLAMGMIFIILVSMFRSFLQPFVVMTAIPFGMIGVVLAFWAHGRPLGFFAFLGLVGLTGVVVNDSIVLVDFINRLRKTGKPRRDSLIEAGRMRLRPVLMTTITTIGGLVSVAYGIGGGDPFLKPMALTIIWGLFFATGLTLLGIPCLYAIFDDLSGRFFHHAMVREEEERIPI